jgi:hypothetical protein
MAGDWIKMRINLDTNPHVLVMASTLGIPELHVVGALWKVWSWADSHSLDGNALSVTDVTLDRFTGVTGFAAALREVGWLAGENGNLCFPRFTEHNGKTAKNRAETAERVAKHRNAKTVTDVTPKPLPEKRREEKRREEVNTPTHTPARLVASEVSEAIKSWHEYWRSSQGCGKPDSEVRIEAMLSRCMSAGWPPSKIVQAIQFGISKNAKSWLDPDADFEKFAKDRANGRAAREPIPLSEKC